MNHASLQMDWTAIRLELRAVRKETKASGRRASGLYLKETAGVDPSTLNRIEGVKKYPNHKPDLETIEALVRAMGLTLSAFFARIEGVSVSPPTIKADDGDSLPATSVVSFEEQGQFLLAATGQLVAAIDRAADRIAVGRKVHAVARKTPRRRRRA